MASDSSPTQTPLKTTLTVQPKTPLLKDIRHLVTDLGKTVRSAWNELLGHGYGHTNVKFLNIVTLVQLAVCVYWGWLAARTPLHNLPNSWRVLSWAQLAHTRLAIAAYNPTNWLATTAYQQWMTLGAVLILMTVSQAFELSYSHHCLNKPARAAEYCPYDTSPGSTQKIPFQCHYLPPLASPCPLSSQSGTQFFVAVAALQTMAYVGLVAYEYVKIQDCRLHALDNVVRANHCVHDHRQQAVDAAAAAQQAGGDSRSSSPQPNRGQGRHGMSAGRSTQRVRMSRTDDG